MKKIITLFGLMLCMFATAQEAVDTMYIYRNDNVIERIPVSKIDSVVFVAPTPQYEAVDLGLSVKWATFNVGATKPEDYGGYYAWGETEEKEDYSWETYKWCNGSNDTMTKYCTNSRYGTIDNKIALDPEDDVAYVKWGGEWRIPTSDEIEELKTKCTWQETILNGINGYEITGPNGNSIFMPVAGYGVGNGVYDLDGFGRYWSSELKSGSNDAAYGLDFGNGYYWNGDYRWHGRSVRPVCGTPVAPVVNYTVSVLNNENGIVLINGENVVSASVANGTEVTVTATANDGYEFAGWFIDGSETPVSTELSYTFTVSKDVALVARFDKVNDKVNDKTNITPEIYERDLSHEDVGNAISVLPLNRISSGIYCLRGGRIQGGTVYKPTEHAYQRQYSLGPDLYAQYFVIPHKDFMYGRQTSTYDMSAEFNSGPLNAYTMAKSVFIPILNQPEINNIPEIKAITLLYYCLSAQEHADLSGPFSYIEDRLNIETPTQYNNLGTIYHDIVNSLDDIVACLKYYEENRPNWYKAEIQNILSRFDFTRSWDTGDYSMNPYIKLANSLKLRMAMHIVKVEPATAKEWAEEAVASGVIESIGEQMGFFQAYDAIGHPLRNIQSWGDIRMSASLESLLMSLNHPYTKTLFKPNNNKIVNRNDNTVLEANTRICGIRSGVYVGTGQDYSVNQYQAYSTFDTDMMTEAPLYFIKWSEVDFLRAEGALRGWDMGGTAQEFYERGIRNADLVEPWVADFFDEIYANLVDEYMAQTEATPYTNIDPIGDGEPWESVTKIGVKWNDGETNETKLEKIITQKYLALFPLSTEAWTELRRTGYPKLFPVLNPEDGDGSIMEGDMIRRIPWVPTDPTIMNAVNGSGIPALGGPDEQATRLWWDVDAPNF